MDHLGGETIRFFVDQVVRQYQELRQDIKADIGHLRGQILQESIKQGEELKDFKEETNQRFEKMDKSILDLQQFRWHLAGVTAVLFAVAEIGFKLIEYYFLRK